MVKIQQQELFKERSRRYSFTLKPFIHDELKRQAMDQGMSTSANLAAMVNEKRKRT